MGKTDTNRKMGNRHKQVFQRRGNTLITSKNMKMGSMSLWLKKYKSKPQQDIILYPSIDKI